MAVGGNLMSTFFFVAEDIKLDPANTSSCISGCEFDYSSNTYRLQVSLSSGSVTIGEYFIIVKVDGMTGNPKVLSIK
jgi:hypothetical protein